MKEVQIFSLTPQEASEITQLAEEVKSGVIIIPEPYGDENPRTVHSDTGDFVKWFRTTNKSIPIHLPKEECPRVLLRSADYWLPLILLSQDVGLQVFLGIVGNYLYDRIKGALKGEDKTIHLNIVHYDERSGVFKKFSFQGNVEALKAVAKKIDVNKLMERDAD